MTRTRPRSTAAAALLLLLLPAASAAQQPNRSYPYSIQINQGQWPYYTSPFLHRTFENGIWVYRYYPPAAGEQAAALPAASAPTAPIAPAPQPATLNIVVPSADANLWIDGVKMRQKGLQRRFVSPPLEAGSSFMYTIRAEWTESGKKIERSEDVPVRAGGEAFLHFFATVPKQ